MDLDIINFKNRKENPNLISLFWNWDLMVRTLIEVTKEDLTAMNPQKGDPSKGDIDWGTFTWGEGIPSHLTMQSL